MAPQATAALKMAVLHLRKSGKSIKSVCQQTGVIERTKRRWITAAKKAGTWEELVSPAPRKRRSDCGRGRKVTGVMVRAIKRRLSYNPRLSTRPKVAPPSTKYLNKTNRSFSRPPHLSKRESFRFQELKFFKWKFPIFSILSLLTFPFVTSTKLGRFQVLIPVLESALNLLSPGLISCLIMFSFDIDMIRNIIYFW